MAGTARSSPAAQGAGRRPTKTLVTTIMISEEAGQRTRVTDMNTSLTFEQEILDDLPSSVSANTKATAEGGGPGTPAEVIRGYEGNDEQ